MVMEVLRMSSGYLENATLVDPDDGDLVTHLQIGQIEIQQ